LGIEIIEEINPKKWGSDIFQPLIVINLRGFEIKALNDSIQSPSYVSRNGHKTDPSETVRDP
jgi:hypothetical protein